MLIHTQYPQQKFNQDKFGGTNYGNSTPLFQNLNDKASNLMKITFKLTSFTVSLEPTNTILL